VLGLAALLGVLACGSVEDPSASVDPSTALTVSPHAATVETGDTLPLHATIGGGAVTDVVWSVAEGDAGGLVTAAGVYTAPELPGVYHVLATRTTDLSSVDRAAVTVHARGGPHASTIAVATSPQSASVLTGGTAQFGATVSGTTNLAVLWSVVETGGGVVSGSGLYTAPGAAGTYHVVATSAADTTKTSSATVTVTAPPPPPPSGVGTGTAYNASYVTSATGGGAMPSWTTNVVNAASFGAKGDGVADDTAALQNAANAARDQGKPLVIPATAAFYKISSYLQIYGSVGGINGMPTIRQTNQAWDLNAVVLRLVPGMTGWVYNLHLQGTFTTWTSGAPPGEWAHGIDVGAVSGVTIKNNLIENVKGDCIGTDGVRNYGGTTKAVNVIVDGNTLRNPVRCSFAAVWNMDRWLVVNNLMDKPVPYVTAVDFEPEIGGYVSNVELGYNKILAGPGQLYGFSDGFAVSMWSPSSSPGTNIYIHHNYGSWPDGFLNSGGGWGTVVNTNNVAGSTPP
jgi:hypothetical protein